MRVFFWRRPWANILSSFTQLKLNSPVNLASERPLSSISYFSLCVGVEGRLWWLQRIFSFSYKFIFLKNLVSHSKSFLEHIAPDFNSLVSTYKNEVVHQINWPEPTINMFDRKRTGKARSESDKYEMEMREVYIIALDHIL